MSQSCVGVHSSCSVSQRNVHKDVPDDQSELIKVGQLVPNLLMESTEKSTYHSCSIPHAEYSAQTSTKLDVESLVLNHDGVSLAQKEMKDQCFGDHVGNASDVSDEKKAISKMLVKEKDAEKSVEEEVDAEKSVEEEVDADLVSQPSITMKTSLCLPRPFRFKQRPVKTTLPETSSACVGSQDAGGRHSATQSWLLRLFESRMFDMSIAICYLFNSKEPGVQTYIGKMM